MIRFLIFFLLLSPSLAQLSNDAHYLLEFKKGIQCDPSGLVTASWVVNAPLSSWHGVTCDPAGSSIVSVDLSNLNLFGDLKFPILTRASFLQALTLAGNNFTVASSLPSARSSLSSAWISRTATSTARNPPCIADLYNLMHLNLSSNNFKGGFPKGIQNLLQLRVLDLRSNSLWGDVKVLMGGYEECGVRQFERESVFQGDFLRNDDFSSVGNMLKYMNFSGNQIGGGFGRNVGLFRNLEVLDLGRNKMSGEMLELSWMSNLKFLRVGWNLMYGLIPEGFFLSGMQLKEIDLRGNGFTGFVHSINSTNLKILNLSSNVLSEPVPSNIGSCTTVDFSENQLSGGLSMM